VELVESKGGVVLEGRTNRIPYVGRLLPKYSQRREDEGRRALTGTLGEKQAPRSYQRGGKEEALYQFYLHRCPAPALERLQRFSKGERANSNLRAAREISRSRASLSGVETGRTEMPSINAGASGKSRKIPTPCARQNEEVVPRQARGRPRSGDGADLRQGAVAAVPASESLRYRQDWV